MRKSQLSSSLGIIGGAPVDTAIVPPAAAAVAHSIIPENNPVLQRLLSDDEIAAVKEHRLSETKPRVRQYSHYKQIQRDMRRAEADQANQRRAKQAKSAVSDYRNGGEAFKLGRAAPLTPQEESDLLGKNLSFSTPPTVEELGELEDALNISVDKDISSKIEAAKPRNRKKLPSNPEGEEGGSSLVSNTLGANPRAQVPSSRKKKDASPVALQPPLEAIGDVSEKHNSRSKRD